MLSLSNFIKFTIVKYSRSKINNGLYYKPVAIINNDSSIVNKLETSPINDARVVIYNRHMFTVQATCRDTALMFPLSE